MASPLRNILKHSSVYSVANLLSKSIAFLLIPVYTRYLTPADYGTLEILTISGQVLIIICTLGIGNGLLRIYLYDSRDREEQKTTATTAYSFVALMTILVFSPAIMFSNEISKLTLNDSLFAGWFIIIFLSGALSANSVIPFQVYRAERQSVRYTLLNLLKFILLLVSNIFFVVFLKLGLVGVLYGSLIGSALVFLLNCIFMRSYMARKISLAMLKQMLRFGLPLLPAMLALWIITSIDRYFLIHFSDLHELGLYSMGIRFAIILEIVFRMPFDTNWPSIYLPLAKKAKAKQEFSKIFSYYLLVGLFLALSLLLFAKPAIHVMTTPDYYDSYRIVPVLVLAFLFRGISSNVGIGIWLSGKTEYQALIMIATAGVNIVLNFVLIPPLGTTGAAVATLISFVFMALAHYIISSKFYPIRYEALRIGKLTLAFVLPLICFYLLSPDSVGMQLIVALTLTSSYILLLLMLNFFEDEEIAWLRQMVQKRKLAFAIRKIL